MTAHGFTKTGGTTPCDFTLDLAYAPPLYAANQGTGNVVALHLRRHRRHARHLSATGGTTSPVPSASFIGSAALP